MAKDLEKPEATEDSSVSGMELTERELAIIDGKDPDALDVVDDPADQHPEQPETDENQGDLGAPVSDEPPSDEEIEAEEAADQKAEETREAEPADWMTDEVRSLAYSYGMTDDELSGFESQEEFERTGRLLDRRLTQIVETPTQEEPKFSYEEWEAMVKSRAENQPSKQPEDAPASQGKIDPEYYRNNDYDDETVKIVETLRAEQERNDRIEALLTQQQEQENQRYMQEEINSFHRAVDSYRPDFFGQTIKDDGTTPRLNQEHTERRSKLYGEVARLAQGMQMSGQAVPGYDVLVRRASGIAFAEDFAK